MASDQKQLLKRLKKQGFTVEHTGGTHLKVCRRGQFVVIPSTPGGGRAYQNTVALLRRIGYQAR